MCENLSTFLDKKKKEEAGIDECRERDVDCNRGLGLELERCEIVIEN